MEGRKFNATRRIIFGINTRTLQEILHDLITGIQNTGWLEFIGVVTGVGSVIYSRRENILVFPVGIISTTIFIYLYLTHGLYADASVNGYYTVMSLIGWVMWTRHKDGQVALQITVSSKKEWLQALLFFACAWLILYVVLTKFTDSTVPQADAFTSGAAFTGMWLMNKKKVENWVWWMVTDLVSVPLNFYKHLVFTSLQYVIFLVLATMGYLTWKEKARRKTTAAV